MYPKLEVMENTGNSVEVVVVDEAGEEAVQVVPGIICLLLIDGRRDACRHRCTMRKGFRILR